MVGTFKGESNSSIVFGTKSSTLKGWNVEILQTRECHQVKKFPLP